MLQHQSYAACDDEVVRAACAPLRAAGGSREQLSGADAERVDEFFRHGMALNVAAAMGVEDLSIDCPWIQAELS